MLFIILWPFFGAQLICQMEQQLPPWKYKLFALLIIIAAAEKLYQNATRYDDIKALISAFSSRSYFFSSLRIGIEFSGHFKII